MRTLVPAVLPTPIFIPFISLPNAPPPIAANPPAIPFPAPFVPANAGVLEGVGAPDQGSASSSIYVDAARGSYVEADSVLDPPKGEGKDVVLVREVLLDVQRSA